MERIGLPDVFAVSPTVEEEIDPDARPGELVAFWSLQKAKSVAVSFADDIVIAADTIVWHDGKVIGKPRDESGAAVTLRHLSGDRHEVYTGLTVIKGDTVVTETEMSAVYMRAMSEDEIAAYIKTGEPMDKAGAYGIQERGALLCERVDGDFYNVMGLPVYRLGKILSSLGVNLFS